MDTTIFRISLFFVFTFCLHFVSSEYGGPSDSASIKPTFNSTAKRPVSLATTATHPFDVVGMYALYGSLQPLPTEQLDDPCFPQQWSWVECSNDATPRVTALYLGGKGLSGSIPDISYMDALVTIDLQKNRISGVIPPFLGIMPNLQELYLANNLFSGSVPDSMACNKNLKLSLSGNPYLSTKSNECESPDPESPSTIINTPESPSTGTNTDDTPSGGAFEYENTNNNKKKNKKKLPIILGSTGSVVGVFWIIVGIFATFRHKAKAAAAASKQGQDGVPNNSTPNPIMNPNASPSEETPMNARASDSV